MNLKMALARARRALRDDLKLYLVAVSSLTVAFLCLAAALLGVANLSAFADHWGESRRMTVYLVDGAPRDDVEQLRLLLSGLSDVRTAEYVSSAHARDIFLAQAEIDADLGALGPDVFPASIEVTMQPGGELARSEEVAERIERLGAVDAVESYGAWFSQLDALLDTGKGLALGLSLLVVICVLAVVGNTIRLSVAGRRDEIEVMKLCGATDGFVRSPFLVEGIFQGLVASALAVLVLFVAFSVARAELDASLAALAGTRSTFLDPLIVLAIVTGGALAGAVGSAISLRRYLAV